MHMNVGKDWTEQYHLSHHSNAFKQLKIASPVYFTYFPKATLIQQMETALKTEHGLNVTFSFTDKARIFQARKESKLNQSFMMEAKSTPELLNMLQTMDLKDIVKSEKKSDEDGVALTQDDLELYLVNCGIDIAQAESLGCFDNVADAKQNISNGKYEFCQKDNAQYAFFIVIPKEKKNGQDEEIVQFLNVQKANMPMCEELNALLANDSIKQQQRGVGAVITYRAFDELLCDIEKMIKSSKLFEKGIHVFVYYENEQVRSLQGMEYEMAPRDYFSIMIGTADIPEKKEDDVAKSSNTTAGINICFLVLGFLFFLVMLRNFL